MLITKSRPRSTPANLGIIHSPVMPTWLICQLPRSSDELLSKLQWLEMLSIRNVKHYSLSLLIPSRNKPSNMGVVKPTAHLQVERIANWFADFSSGHNP